MSELLYKEGRVSLTSQVKFTASLTSRTMVLGRSLTDRNFQLSGKPCARAHSRTVSTRFCCYRNSVKCLQRREKEIRNDAQWGESPCSLAHWVPPSSSQSGNIHRRRCGSTSRPVGSASHCFSGSLVLLAKSSSLHRALWRYCILCSRRRRRRRRYTNISAREQRAALVWRRILKGEGD